MSRRYTPAAESSFLRSLMVSGLTFGFGDDGDVDESHPAGDIHDGHDALMRGARVRTNGERMIPALACHLRQRALQHLRIACDERLAVDAVLPFMIDDDLKGCAIGRRLAGGLRQLDLAPGFTDAAAGDYAEDDQQ